MVGDEGEGAEDVVVGAVEAGGEEGAVRWAGGAEAGVGDVGDETVDEV